MEHLKEHADYKYNKPRKITTKYSLFGKNRSVTINYWLCSAMVSEKLTKLNSRKNKI